MTSNGESKVKKTSQQKSVLRKLIDCNLRQVVAGGGFTAADFNYKAESSGSIIFLDPDMKNELGPTNVGLS